MTQVGISGQDTILHCHPLYPEAFCQGFTIFHHLSSSTLWLKLQRKHLVSNQNIWLCSCYIDVCNVPTGILQLNNHLTTSQNYNEPRIGALWPIKHLSLCQMSCHPCSSVTWPYFRCLATASPLRLMPHGHMTPFKKWVHTYNCGNCLTTVESLNDHSDMLDTHD